MPSALDPHYLWAFGHLTVLINSVYIIIQMVLFRGTPAIPYRLLYVGALLSYAIVVFKSLGKPTGVHWVRRAFVDENAQYALLAFYWLISKPIAITILPFATFSLFHCVTFLRTNILPKFSPKTPTAGAGAGAAAARPPANWADNMSRQIQTWVKGNYDKAMNFVAFSELVILLRLVVGAITFRSSFIAPIFLAHFIRLRYHASPFTRSAVNMIGGKIDNTVAGQAPAVRNIWNQVKRVLGAWGGGNLTPRADGTVPPTTRPAAATGAASSSTRPAAAPGATTGTPLGAGAAGASTATATGAAPGVTGAVPRR